MIHHDKKPQQAGGNQLENQKSGPSCSPALDLNQDVFIPSPGSATTTDRSTIRTVSNADSIPSFNASISTLNAKITAAAGAVIAAHGAAVSVVLPDLIQAAPGWLLAYGATIIGLGVVMRTGLVQFVVQRSVKSAGQTEENALSYERVAHSLERLSSKRQEPLAIHVAIKESTLGLASMIDRVFHKDVLSLTDGLVKKLSDRELDALVAHEVSHSNRAWSKFEQTHVFLHNFSSPTVFWGAALATYGAVSQIAGTFLGSGAALVAATTAWAGTLTSIATVRFYASRQNELKTDLRAVQMTGDPEAYISMLEKVTQYGERKSGPIRIPTFLSTHPPLEERQQKVRKVFAEPAKTP
jgi:Zn-dependent protease with chaperone function